MSEDKENKALDEKDQKENNESDVEKNNVDANKSLSETGSKSDEAKSGNKLSFIVPIILVVIFSVAFIFINNRLNEIEGELDQSNIKSNSVAQDSDDRLKETLSRFSSIQKKLEELESKQDVLSHSISQPVEQQMNVNEDYALAEIEHLLIIASYNLQLDHNVVTALSAMEAADARLKGLTDPAVLSVREQLIADMNELRSLNQADLSGLALFLSDLIGRVDELALKENVVLETQEIASVKNEEPVEGIKHFFALVYEELKSLVVITRDKDVGKARLLPDEVYFLRANLKLELANARFAVFNRDTENFRVSIDHMQKWLNEYFDMADANVSNIYGSLSSMKKIDLAFPEIDLSSSLESVRALSHMQDSRMQDSHHQDENIDEEGLNSLQ
jgi:uroporphyrin-III C-methyltransferase